MKDQLQITVPAAATSAVPGRQAERESISLGTVWWRQRLNPAASLLVVAMLASLAGCGAGPGIRTPARPRPTGSAGAVRSTPTPTACVDTTLAGMAETERIGQLFMVGESSADPASAAVAQAITQYHAGGVLLYGTGWNSAPLVRTAAARVQSLAAANGGIGLLVAGNQEGGRQGSLQAFYGPGFAPIPPALIQGTLPPATLEGDAHTWGSQLESAGINLDLAPVMDVVPTDMASTNAPIGQLDREYGHDPQTVAVHGSAFIRGMLRAGVQVTEKHFPGLGRVQGNTDFTANVTDSVTTRHDPFLEPFEAGIQAGAGFVMVSTAIYTRIDPTQQAVFSPIVIDQMLRGDLGFQGVVISDDLGQAAAVSGVPVPQRALRFLAAGGDIVLTQAPSDIAPMEAAVLQRMASDTAFAAQVSAAVRRVLLAKERLGLLPGC